MEIIRILFLFFFVVFEIAFLSFAVFVLASGFISQAKGAPYVPLPKKSIKNILKFAEIENGGDFYDLGSGDGRVLIEAVKNFRVKRAVGYEISPWPYWKSRFLIRYQNLKEKIDIFKEDFQNSDLREADSVFLYLYPEAVKKLIPKFKEELAFGSRIISASFPIDESGKLDLKLIKTGKIDRFNLFLYEKI